MKKKMVCVLLGMVMIAVSLSGCGGGAGAGADNGTASMDAYTKSEQSGGYDGMIVNSPQIAEDAGFDMANSYATADAAEAPMDEMAPQDWNTEEYSALEEAGFKSVANDPLSTFSADVDTASYSNVRRMIEQGYTMDEIPEGAVRIEEMLNYFSYDYNLPKKNEPFGVTTVIGDCPWNEEAKLLQIGLKTQMGLSSSC